MDDGSGDRLCRACILQLVYCNTATCLLQRVAVPPCLPLVNRNMMTFHSSRVCSLRLLLSSLPPLVCKVQHPAGVNSKSSARFHSRSELSLIVQISHLQTLPPTGSHTRCLQTLPLCSGHFLVLTCSFSAGVLRVACISHASKHCHFVQESCGWFRVLASVGALLLPIRFWLRPRCLHPLSPRYACLASTIVGLARR